MDHLVRLYQKASGQLSLDALSVCITCRNLTCLFGRSDSYNSIFYVQDMVKVNKIQSLYLYRFNEFSFFIIFMIHKGTSLDYLARNSCFRDLTSF